MVKAVAFTVGPLTFHWYGIIIAIGILSGFLAAVSQAKKRGENPEHLFDILFWGLPAAIICARLYYVIFMWDYYAANPGEIVAIWHGGLAIHGGLIGAVVTTLLYTRHHKLSFWKWADICAPSLILGQAIGRWGNFINQEAFGAPTNVPWAIYIDYANRPIGYEGFNYFHPTFLYESAWDFGVFLLMLLLSNHQRKNNRIAEGNLLFCYFALYSMGRFFTEGLRLDSLMFGSFRVAQLVSIGLVMISIGVYAYRQRQHD